MRKTGLFMISLFLITAVLAARCGGNGVTEEDADTDTADTTDTTDTADVPPDTTPDTPPDTIPDADAEGDIPVETGACYSNDDCNDTDFCKFMAGVCEGPGECSWRGSGECLTIYAPVCGCDNVTYGNECTMRYAGVSLQHTGECAGAECTMGDPAGVCDEETEFCEGPEGVCADDVAGWCEIRPEMCPEFYSPVCGCDGNTYGNDCERQTAGVWLAYDGGCVSEICFMGDPGGVCAADEFCNGPAGVCDDATPGWCSRRPELCPGVWDPVCGCDGNTYGNDCTRQAAGVWLDHRGECGTMVCYQGDPGRVCGPGEFCDGPEGACFIFDVPGWCTEVPEVCPEVLDPVCGCDGRTYMNDCMRAAARVWRNHRGECSITPPPECGPLLPPCPDSQFCEYPPGDCGRNPGSTGVCTGMPGLCPPLWDPVCGCDGNTYANDCTRQSAGVSLLYRGECIPVPPTAGN